MFTNVRFNSLPNGNLSRSTRNFSSSAVRAHKVAVLGASGGIGQPLSLLLKLSHNVSRLSLFDIVNTPGVAADISHVNSPAKVSGHVGPEQLKDALIGADVVVIPAGVPRKPGMTRDDLFNTNASIVRSLAQSIAKNSPKALVLVISNPVNSTVPIVAEVFKQEGVYDPKRLFGVTTLDVVRANTFVSELKGLDVNKTKVTVIGGHAGITILPLLSQIPGVSFSTEELDSLTKRIQFGGDEVVQAKAGAGSATLSMAYAGLKYTESILRGLNGEKGIIEPSFVQSDVIPGLDFFASPVELGPNGIEKVHHFGKISAYEEKKLQELIPELKGSISKGINWAKDAAKK